ncbi:hypothetical protein VTO42DRAFT_230 [Malbranchea cinnamomea]
MAADSEDKKGKAPIPKFASFKPKSSPVPAPDETRAKHSYDEERELVSKDRSHVKGASEDASRAHYRKRDVSRDRSRERSPYRSHGRDRAYESRQRFTDVQKGGQDTSLYKIDTKGDKYNVIYGSLHRYDVPHYDRWGRGRVLGLPPNYRIDRDSEDAKSLIVRPYVSTSETAKLKSKNAFWKLATKETRFRLVRHESDSQANLDLQKDFLPIYRHGSRKRRRIDGRAAGLVSDDENSRDYRSIEGRAKPEVDSDVTSASDFESDNEDARKIHAQLSRRVSECADDVDAWLQLINHQECLVGRVDRDGHRILTAAEKSGVSDIKLSLYEKALGKIPPHAARDRLLLGMMEEGSKIWDTKTLSSKWKNLLRSNPSYILLWMKYLDFQQTQFLSFTYDQCKAFFIECLKLNARHENAQDRQIINLYILLRLSHFMREAGFTEHAVALWQSVLEFNFYQPQDIDVLGSYDAATSSFARFWESEVPRIGEPGAKGWSSLDNAPMAPKSDSQFGGGINKSAIFESWIQQEQSCALSSQLPARTLDEVREDDPFRVILFSDIADCLLPFSHYGLSDLLVNSFLLFCHLPPLISQKDVKSHSSWRVDPFLYNILLDQLDDISSKWFCKALGASDTERQISPLISAPENFASTTDTLFNDGKSWFSALQTWRQTYAGNRDSMYSQWVRQTIQQLVECLPDNDLLAEYAVALEFSCNPKHAKKYAKSLLRKRPSSIRLYNGYALIEAYSGEMSAAEQVWMTTLTMSQNFGEKLGLDFILLWKSWAWKALENNEIRKAIRLLLSIPNQNWDRDRLQKNVSMDSSVNAAEFLKAQRFLADIQGSSLAFRKEEGFAHATECLALLVYLFQGQSIEHAVDVYKAAVVRLESLDLGQGLAAELVHQAKARLLYHHAMSTRLYKPALARSELIDSISRFPQNTILLSIFAWNEFRFRIDDRVRSVLRQHTLPNAQQKTSASFSMSSTLIPHLFSIYTELHRGVSAGSTIHSARRAFEAVVTSDSGRFSAAAWKLYVLFELRLGEKSRAKDVFYRSIRACPWAKELVLQAFREPGLRDQMGFDELRKVWNVLVEKELRIHVDLEPWFEEHDHEFETAGDGKRGENQYPVRMPNDPASDEEMHDG